MDESAEWDLENAAKFVIEDCQSKGEKVSESLAAYTLQLLYLNPELQEKEDKDQIIKDVIEQSIETLLNTNDPFGLTLKLQVYFDLNYRTASEFLTEHEAAYNRVIQPFLKKLLSISCPTTMDYNLLHIEIIKFVMMQEIVDHKQDPQTFREMEKAVSTILPVNELDKFLDLPQKERKAYLYTLAPVAVGIRLYKWQEGITKSRINDIAKVAAMCAPKLAMDFLNEIEATEELIKFIREILYHYHFVVGTYTEITLDLRYLHSYLIFLNQYHIFLSMMMGECNAMTYRILSLEHYYHSVIQHLKSVLASASVASSLLFSLYSDISQVWKALKNELLFLHSLLAVFRNIKHFRKNCCGNCTDSEIADLWREFVENDFLENHKQKAEAVAKESADSKTEPIETVFPDGSSVLKIPTNVTKNLDEVYLKLEGYCPWALVHGKGLVFKGNRSFGIAKYQNCCYTFCSSDGLEDFCKNPSYYLDAVVTIVRQKPQLIVLFNLIAEFDLEMWNANIFARAYNSPIITSHRSCQTEPHPFRANYDPCYEWNQWTMRKQVMQYVNIKKKQTRSIQTLRSYFRRDNFTQVYLKKNNEAQTKRDATTQTLMPGAPEFVFKIKTSIP